MTPQLIEYWQMAYLPEGCVIEYENQRLKIIGRAISPIVGYVLEPEQAQPCPNCVEFLSKAYSKPLEFNNHGIDI